MRSIPPSVAAHRARRLSSHAEYLIWVRARNRATGGEETLGLWTGADHQQIQIGAELRDYYGAGNVLRIEPIRAVAGIEVRSYEVGLAAVSPEVEQIIRGYETRLAPVEIHRAEYDDDQRLLAAPLRIFRGWIDGVEFPVSEVGGNAEAVARLVSAAAALARHGSDTKSDAVQQRRSGDRFRRFGSITGAEVAWGEVRAGGASSIKPITDQFKKGWGA